jgi:hypothetical protein
MKFKKVTRKRGGRVGYSDFINLQGLMFFQIGKQYIIFPSEKEFFSEIACIKNSQLHLDSRMSIDQRENVP